MAAAVVDNQSGKQSRIQGLGNFDHSHTAVEYYFGVSNTHERKDFIEHAERVAEIVEIYAGDIVSPAVVDAALLHDVAERVMDTARPPEVRQAAARMVAERLTSPDLAEESLTYLASVIGDLGFIETAAESYRSVIAHAEDIDEETKLALTTSYQNDLSPELYRVDEPILDFAHLKCISEQVNIESIIVKAAEMIDNLTHPNPHRPASALQDIIEAETFYAPLLEQLKLDAMASKLRTESKKLRYTRSGVNAEYEATAIDTLDMIRRNGSEEIIAALFGKHTHEVEFKTIAVSDGEPTLFGSGTLRNAEFDFRDIHYRAKSIGSHIDKLERFNGEEILDAFGITVVVGSDENIAEKYVDTVAKLLDNPVVELVAAPSKKKPGYVQGSPTYVGQVESQARKLGIVEHLQIKPKENAPDLYSICKVTLKVTLPCGDIVPVEIQMLTDKDREGARVGLQAHNLYKQYERRSEQNVDPLVLVKYLKDISRRRDKIDSEGVLANNGSLARSETLLSTIDEQLSYALAV